VVQLALFRGSYSAILIFSVVFWLRRVRRSSTVCLIFSMCSAAFRRDVGAAKPAYVVSNEVDGGMHE
jgi:hypothetical protein